ncbi:hypothetical protein A6A06_23850 [Streptomyces sp. CB02923]|uniref:DUF4232 domain-containing protein n=1 Tax=Streptomyces sp. CB02923 TaxID=1718985 RepID=UPI00093F65E6|nr:DUF4232 domain-containing protein [Streptomyces sp. CB02923]OKI00195.1 hypothetical protein A6A06_23850 [Streptomyces sp. CB02923]
MPRDTVTEAATARRARRRAVGGRPRTRMLRAVAAGLTATAALGLLSACGGQQALKTSDAKPFHPFGKDSGGSDEPLGPGMPSSSHTDLTASSGSHPACDPSKVVVAAKPLPQPPGHLLLQVTNVSSAACDLYGFPHLRAGSTVPATGPHGKAAPPAPLTLAPGGTAYAALTPSPDGSGHEASTLTVGFTDHHGRGIPGAGAHVRLPGGVRIGNDAQVTFWTYDVNQSVHP